MEIKCIFYCEAYNYKLLMFCFCCDYFSKIEMKCESPEKLSANLEPNSIINQSHSSQAISITLEAKDDLVKTAPTITQASSLHSSSLYWT